MRQKLKQRRKAKKKSSFNVVFEEEMQQAKQAELSINLFNPKKGEKSP